MKVLREGEWNPRHHVFVGHAGRAFWGELRKCPGMARCGKWKRGPKAQPERRRGRMMTTALNGPS
jgi:hypothetical protein